MLMIETALEHPERRELNDEVHARPPDSLPTPCSLTYIARLPKRDPRSGVGKDLLGDLLQRFGQNRPDRATNHFTTTLGSDRLRWERHTEYNRYTFVAPVDADDTSSTFHEPGIPADWLEQMRGEIFVGVRAKIIGPKEINTPIDELSRRCFNGNTLVGSRVADDGGLALTDLCIHEDGFSRVVLINETMSEAQTGRVLQRLFEIETYRMMALLALQRLTRLSASSQSRHQRSNYRFAAADAYYEIVLQRISELRETRIPGLQTFEEFTTRRLTPAVKTYRAVSERQQSILEQMARATKLLSTRIDISRQQQNQSLLSSMNRRVKMQLRLQATVEGLSVAAVTYYVVGLVGTLARGIESMGVPLNQSLVSAVSIPIVAGIAFLGIRQLRKKISREELE